MAAELNLSISTNAYAGYDLVETLDHLAAATDCRQVELDAIAGLFHHVDDERAGDATYDAGIVEALVARGFTSFAFSGHCDLGDPAAWPVFARKMQLAHDLGARVINTFAGKVSERASFFATMHQVVELAEALDLDVNLETANPSFLVFDHADREVIREVASSRVGINYDFGNVFMASDGQIDLLEDFALTLPDVRYLHLKDGRKVDGAWRPTALHGGIVDYEEVFRLVAASGRTIPMSIEVPLRLRVGPDGSTVSDEIPSLVEIDDVISTSVARVHDWWRGAGAPAGS